MSREQVFDQSVDSAVAFTAQFGVFVDCKILGPANLLRIQKRSRSFAPEVIEFRALHNSCHVCLDSIQWLDAGKSTSVPLTSQLSGGVGFPKRKGMRWRRGRRKEKERGARRKHERPLPLIARSKRAYCVKVNLPSLDHLLLGKPADIDEKSHVSSITRYEENFRPQEAQEQRAGMIVKRVP